jgi:hypothetical protein
MRSTGKPPEAELAAALDTWADARERAISDLKAGAITLEEAGQKKEATRLRRAANHLHARMIEERRRASQLRAEAQDRRAVEPLSDTSKIELETA